MWPAVLFDVPLHPPIRYVMNRSAMEILGQAVIHALPIEFLLTKDHDTSDYRY